MRAMKSHPVYVLIHPISLIKSRRGGADNKSDGTGARGIVLPYGR